MACINILTNENQAHNTMGPRISFSHDFSDPQLHTNTKLENYSYREAPVSSDFAFSIPNNTMITADQIICKGKLLPLKGAPTTLRDELLSGDDDYEDILRATVKSTSRWKERFGLKRSNVKKNEKSIEGAPLERIDEMKTSNMLYEDIFANFKGSSGFISTVRKFDVRLDV